jgi:hypothetical protein
MRPEYSEIKDYDRKNPVPGDGWQCGARGRRLLTLAYAIAFTCLLRVDEVLRIEHRHIKLLDANTIEFRLDYRKTSQFGRE